MESILRDLLEGDGIYQLVHYQKGNEVLVQRSPWLRSAYETHHEALLEASNDHD